MKRLTCHLSVDELRRRFAYDPRTGELTHRLSHGPKLPAGRRAGFTQKGHTTVVVTQKHIPAARIAWALHYGEILEEPFVYKNGDATDLRIDNLVPSATWSGVTATSRLRSNNNSGYKGVSCEARRNCWRADIKDKGRAKCLGRFKSAEQAARVYQRAAERIYGKFAVIGKQVLDDA